MKKILFSPVGTSDPISGQHDGALLHIIRVYRPEKVYLYMSKEICEFEDKDNRYSYCLKKLKDHLDMDFEIEYMRKEELTEVHVFDFFLQEYGEIIENIYDGESELLLNVSSGTPAMKSALQNLSAIMERSVLPIQVATPSKKINDRENIKGDYSVELQWELNIDNEENYENRCTVSSIFNMSLEVKKKLIIKHVEAYDYVAALRVLEPIKTNINEKAGVLIRAGAARLKLDKSSCSKLCKSADYDMYPVKTTDQWNLFEYLLVLKVKLIKEEYTDFLRGMTPLSFVLMERIIDRSGQVDLKEYTYMAYTSGAGKMGGVYKWREDKIAGNFIFEEIRNTKGPVTNKDYSNIISKLQLDSNIKKLVADIRSIEEALRNPVAHTITHMTNDVIKQYTNGIEAEGIFKKLKKLAGYAGVRIDDEYLKTYDYLNDKIKGLIMPKLLH